MSLSSIGLPNSIDTPFLRAGFNTAKAGQSSYLRFDAGDSQSYTLLATDDDASPQKGALQLLSKAAGPAPVQTPLTIKPDGSVTTGALSCSALTVNGQPYTPGGGGGGGVPSVNGITSAVTIAVDSSMTLNTSGSTITLTSKGGAAAGVTTLNGLSDAVTIAGTGAASVTTSGQNVNIAVAPNGFVLPGEPTYQSTVSCGGSLAGNVNVFDTSAWPAGLYACVALGTFGGTAKPDDTGSPICAQFMLTKWGWFTAPLPANFGTGTGNAQRYILGPYSGTYAPPGGSASAVGNVAIYMGGANLDQMIAQADTDKVSVSFQVVAYRIA